MLEQPQQGNHSELNVNFWVSISDGTGDERDLQTGRGKDFWWDEGYNGIQTGRDTSDIGPSSFWQGVELYCPVSLRGRLH